MKKTLGGDRLGAGKKMQVDLHGYGRSTFDLSYVFRSTMSAGTLVPFMSEVALPGDTFDINLDIDVKTHPTIGPLFGSYKVQCDVFFAPLRLYNALLHNNKIGIGMTMNKVFLPVLELEAPQMDLFESDDPDNAQISPSCILSYLGIRGVGYNDAAPSVERTFNGVPLLVYWEIYKQYYSNKMEQVGYVIHNGGDAGGAILALWVGGVNVAGTAGLYVGNQSTAIQLYWTTGIAPNLEYIFIEINDGSSTKWVPALDLAEWELNTGGGNNWYGKLRTSKYPQVTIFNYRVAGSSDSVNVTPQPTQFSLAAIDDAKEGILSSPSTTVPFNISSVLTQAPYLYVAGTSDATYGKNRRSSQEGLGLKTYQSDLFNNWLLTEFIDGPNGVNEITSIDVSGGSFTLDTLNLSKKVYELLNRIAVSGGTYNDWLNAAYGHEAYSRQESPAYMGGLIKELAFQEVVSNAATGESPLGTLGGRGVLTKKHKGGKIYIKCDEPGYIMGIVSLTPRVDYSQGNKWDVHLRTLDDLHKPGLDEIGFQDRITEDMAWFDAEYTGSEWVQRSAGKQPAWINYMTNVNRTFGNFAVRDNEMFMTLNRRYELGDGPGSSRIKDLTTYIDPVKFNHIFADTAIDAQNFWTQIAVDITARRKMSARLMPNL